MPTTGFLGTRADALIDLAIVFFVLAPFLMIYALRLAAQRRHREHRNLQAGLLLAAIVAWGKCPRRVVYPFRLK